MSRATIFCFKCICSFVCSKPKHVIETGFSRLIEIPFFFPKKIKKNSELSTPIIFLFFFANGAERKRSGALGIQAIMTLPFANRLLKTRYVSRFAQISLRHMLLTSLQQTAASKKTAAASG